MSNLRNVVYLSEAQYATLLGGGTVGGLTLNADDIYLTPTVNPVDGPATSTAYGIATFASTTGNLLTSPSATVTPSGIISSAGYKTIDGAFNAPSYTFISAPTSGMFLSSLGELSFSVNASEKLKISSAGQVTLSNFTSAGFVKTNSSGLLSVDTGSYLPIPSAPYYAPAVNDLLQYSASFGWITVSPSEAGLVTTTGDQTISGTKTFAKTIINQNMTDGSTAAFTNPHLALVATNQTDTTGFVGITMATSATANYGFSLGALRSTGGDGSLVIRNHNNSTQGNEVVRFSISTLAGVMAMPSGSIIKTSTGTLNIQTGGGNGNVDISPNGTGFVNINSTVASTAYTNGALVVDGGLGVAGKIYTNGNVTVNGTLYATAKSFQIDHPTKPGKKLCYGSLEGPENGVYLRGKLCDNNKIELPEYWSKLVDYNSITVALTPIKSTQKLVVTDIQDGFITIKNKSWLNKKIECFYVVYGERKDIKKLEVEMEAE